MLCYVVACQLLGSQFYVGAYVEQDGFGVL